ncbi:MAG: pilus assembly protein PilM [Pseudomonadota bacterium]|nr:pilus assembly protein PilM [Pseudomonadota bacterium]
MALFKRRNRCLGIDISPTAVKLVELSHTGRQHQVEAAAVEPLAEGAMADRNPADPGQVGEAIRRALKASGSRLKQAIVAVPTSGVIIRVLPLSADLDEDEIEANIQIEAAQYIPFPLEEIYLDFQVQGRSKADAAMQEVMLVASRKENVDLREAALKEADLSAAVVDVEGYALENTYRLLSAGLALDDAARVALIDIGATITALHVLHDDRIIYIREQPFGGEQLTAAIADAYNLPRDKAELAKRSGELSEDYAATILAPYRRSAAEQVGHALQFFFSSSHYHSVDHIVLVGGGALVAGLDRAVTEVLGVPASIGNPFASMACAPRVNPRSLARDAPLYAVACGLALRSLD